MDLKEEARSNREDYEAQSKEGDKGEPSYAQLQVRALQANCRPAMRVPKNCSYSGLNVVEGAGALPVGLLPVVQYQSG